MVQVLLNFILRLVAAIGIIYLLAAFTNNKFEQLKTVDRNVNYITMAERDKHLLCLAKNIYFEAATEPFEGKVAVAQVTINRANSGRFPDDICDVVFQKTKRADRIVCQFSWYCERGPKVVRSAPHYQESEMVARKVLLENFRLPSLTGAMYYHADYVSPNWNLPKITKIGRHIFYGEKK
jgi:spore germination cell wall hydrolase CwlJ-like protein